MISKPEPSAQEVLAGLIERVTFHNAENGFCVLRAKARGHRDLVTVVGHVAIISAGEWITASRAHHAGKVSPLNPSCLPRIPIPTTRGRAQRFDRHRSL